ncbi:MAG TPA: hypothetical protein VEY07_04140 [Thermoplasmata archaeon]|nr:hypothetical protein [Thermoplasmata archaeon]
MGGPRTVGLASLMRRGTVTEILFVFECTVAEPAQLRPIAERLGLTVQAASHSFRRLAERGLVEFRDGRYRASVKGVAWLHDALGQLTADLGERVDRLHVIRSCRALALEDLARGDPASLELTNGVLGARRGSAGPSRGRVTTGGRKGSLVEIGELEGILPLPRGRVEVLTVSPRLLDDPRARAELRRRLVGSSGILAAPSLEAFHLASRTTHRPILRFGVGPACSEASRVGVDSTVVLLEPELPRFLEQFVGPDPPPLSVHRLDDARTGGARRRRRAP